MFEDHERVVKQDKYNREFFESIQNRKNTFWDHKSSKGTKKKKSKARRHKNRGKMEDKLSYYRETLF